MQEAIDSAHLIDEDTLVQTSQNEGGVLSSEVMAVI